MAVSKVVLGDETLIDLTGDSVSSENLLQGETAHGANGEEVIGGVVVTPMYTGTKAAIEEAIALGQIPEDAVVNITDDEETSSFQTQINEINNSLIVLTATLPTTVNAGVSIPYPNGFNQDNCVVVSESYFLNDDNSWNTPIGNMNTSLYLNEIKVYLRNSNISGRPVKIILKKYTY